MKIVEEFKAFAMRGNVMDMAVGIIIGAAFGKIVSSAVSDLLMPVIGLMTGGVNFTDLKFVIKPAQVDAATGVVKAASTINYGNFLQTTVDFVIVAFAIFLMIKGMNSLKKKEAAAPTVPPIPSKEEILLTQIRDAIKEKR